MLMTTISNGKSGNVRNTINEGPAQALAMAMTITTTTESASKERNRGKNGFSVDLIVNVW
jgi:hypothetical protein